MMADGLQKHQLEEPIDGEATAGPVRPNLVGEQCKHLAQANGRRLERRDHHEGGKQFLQTVLVDVGNPEAAADQVRLGFALIHADAG